AEEEGAITSKFRTLTREKRRGAVMQCWSVESSALHDPTLQRRIDPSMWLKNRMGPDGRKRVQRRRIAETAFRSVDLQNAFVFVFEHSNHFFFNAQNSDPLNLITLINGSSVDKRSGPRRTIKNGTQNKARTILRSITRIDDRDVRRRLCCTFGYLWFFK